MANPVCDIEISMLEDYHIEPSKYNLAVNITEEGNIHLILNNKRIFQSLKYRDRIVGSLYKELSKVVDTMSIPTQDFAYLNDREMSGDVNKLVTDLINKRIDALEKKERKGTK